MVFVDDVFFSVLITMPFSRSAYPMSCVPLPFSLGTFLTSILFQSTLSVRRATKAGLLTQDLPAFQSTLSVRRATG